MRNKWKLTYDSCIMNWKKEKRVSEDQMARWHHRCNGHELGQTSGGGEGQGGLVRCSPWGRKESDMTGWLNWTELMWPWNFVERDLGRRDDGNSNEEEEMTTDHFLQQRIESITDGRTGESFSWESRDWCVLEIIRVLQMKTNIGWASWDEMFVYC